MSWFFQGPPRLSGLEAPIMMLTGHEGDIFTCKFSPDGQMLASSGFDRLICKYIFFVHVHTYLYTVVSLGASTRYFYLPTKNVLKAIKS